MANASSTMVSVLLAKDVQQIDGFSVSNKTYKQTFTFNATATSGLPVSYSSSDPSILFISGNLATATGAGAVTVTAFQSGNGSWFGVTTTGIITVNKAPQTITFPTLGYMTYGTSVPANATTTSGLIVSLSVTGPNAVIVGSNISFTGVGNVTITAYQLGNANYFAATSINQSFVVYQGFQNFTIVGLPGTVTYTTPPFSYDVLFTSGLPALITFAGPAAIANNSATVLGLGIVTVTAFQGGNALYRPTTIVRYFQIYKANQTITFPSLGNKLASSPPFAIVATATSGLTVTFSIVSGPASVSGDIITLNGTTGVVSVLASQSGNTYFNSAPNVQRTFNVNPGRLGAEEAETSEVSLYPNPASGYVYLSSDMPENDVEVYNALGSLILKAKAVTNGIDVSSLSGGLYTFKVINSSGVHTKKVVIE